MGQYMHTGSPITGLGDQHAHLSVSSVREPCAPSVGSSKGCHEFVCNPMPASAPAPCTAIQCVYLTVHVMARYELNADGQSVASSVWVSWEAGVIWD